MKCPKCGTEMIQGIYDYGIGFAYGDCMICEKCFHVEVLPLAEAITETATSIVEPIKKGKGK